MNLSRLNPFVAIVALIVLVALAVPTAGVAARLITSANIKNRTIKSVDIRKAAVTSTEIKNSTVSEADLAPSVRSKLGKTGARGATGPKGATGSQGSKGDRGSSAWETIPSGTTVRGTLNWSDTMQADGDTHAAFFQLPALPPDPLADEDEVLFADDLPNTTAFEDPSCTGTPAAPTAPAGMLCMYLTGASGILDNSLQVNTMQPEEESLGGWSVVWEADGVSGDITTFRGTWAYQAA